MCPRRRSKVACLAYLCLFHCDEFVVIELSRPRAFSPSLMRPRSTFSWSVASCAALRASSRSISLTNSAVGRIGRKPGRGFRGCLGAFVYFAFGFPERAVVVTRWLHGGGPDRCARSSDRVRRGNATPGSRHFGCATLRPVTALPLQNRHRQPPPRRPKASQAGLAYSPPECLPQWPRRFIVPPDLGQALCRGRALLARAGVQLPPARGLRAARRAGLRSDRARCHPMIRPMVCVAGG